MGTSSLTQEQSSIWGRYRPYFDLGQSTGGPLHVLGVEQSYRHLEAQANLIGVQVQMPASFRSELIRETGLADYDVEEPEQLPPGLRTPQWQHFCELLRNCEKLPEPLQYNVMDLLARLAFHGVVVERISAPSPDDIAAGALPARFAMRRAVSQMVCRMDHGLDFDPEPFVQVARWAPVGCASKVSAALMLVAQLSKIPDRPVPDIEYWAGFAASNLPTVKTSIDPFAYRLLESIRLRAVGFLPMLHGDHRALVAHMDQCEQQAASIAAIATNPDQALVAAENVAVVTQSRLREAAFLGNLDLEEERAKRLTQLDEMDAIYWGELGAVLLKRSRFEQAAGAYQKAAGLGPPRTEMSLFYAGQCLEATGNLTEASAIYGRLDQLATLMGASGTELLRWTRERLDGLGARAEESGLIREEA